MSTALPSIYLIRHGETEWSLDGRHTGKTDLPLTQAGQDMARDLDPWLAAISFDAVLTSPMRRAWETCEGAALAARAQISSDLSEWDYGDYEGRTSVDIFGDDPGWDLFRDGAPGGETVLQVSQRADRLIARLIEIGGTIALFSHGQFGCSLAARWAGLAVGEAVHLTLGAGSVSLLGPKPGHPAIPALIRWNGGPPSALGEARSEAI